MLCGCFFLFSPWSFFFFGIRLGGGGRPYLLYEQMGFPFFLQEMSHPPVSDACPFSSFFFLGLGSP